MRREHNEDADDMSEQRMSRATKLGDADHLRSSREEAKLNAGCAEERSSKGRLHSNGEAARKGPRE